LVVLGNKIFTVKKEKEVTPR